MYSDQGEAVGDGHPRACRHQISVPDFNPIVFHELTQYFPFFRQQVLVMASFEILQMNAPPCPETEEESLQT